jgi:hypothetical protein
MGLTLMNRSPERRGSRAAMLVVALALTPVSPPRGGSNGSPGER